MMSKTIPSNYTERKAWVANFLAVLEPIVADFGMLATDLDVAKNFNMTFATDVDDYATKKQELADASAARKTSGGNINAVVRPIIDRINHHPAMTDEIRAELGLRPRNASQAVPTPIEELVPAMQLEPSREAVIVHWGPNPTNEGRNGKPEGVKGACIYRKKDGESSFQIVGYATKSPHYDIIEGPAADYTYFVRYRGTKATDVSRASDEVTIGASGLRVAA